MLMMMSDQAAEINKFVDRDSDIDASHCMTYTAQLHALQVHRKCLRPSDRGHRKVQ